MAIYVYVYGPPVMLEISNLLWKGGIDRVGGCSWILGMKIHGLQE
jgi:hypothetical protein